MAAAFIGVLQTMTGDFSFISLPALCIIFVCVSIRSQAAEALDYLHTRNPPVYHRDVKSGNFALTLDLRPKLIDCGLAK